MRSKQGRGAQLEADTNEDSLLKSLEDHFLSCNVDVLASWIDPQHSPLLPSCLKTAAEFAKKQHLANLVREQNTSQGMYVRTATMIGHFNESLRAPEAFGFVSEVEEVSGDMARMCAMRWRRRFGIDTEACVLKNLSACMRKEKT